MSDFVPNNRYWLEVLIFFFHSMKTAAEAHRELQKVYRDAALSKTACRDWFRRFKGGDFNFDDRPREGRSCFSIESCPPSHFQAIACVRNDSKTGNLSSL